MFLFSYIQNMWKFKKCKVAYMVLLVLGFSSVPVWRHSVAESSVQKYILVLCENKTLKVTVCLFYY